MNTHKIDQVFHKSLLLPALALLLIAVLTALVPARAWAEVGQAPARQDGVPDVTLYVSTTGDDDNDCLNLELACLTLGAAITKAPAGSTISIAAGTYFESNLILSKDLTLIGAARKDTTIDAIAKGRIFTVEPGATVMLRNLTLQNGVAESGGAIYNKGKLTLVEVDVYNNSAQGHVGTPGLAISDPTTHGLDGAAGRDGHCVAGIGCEDSLFNNTTHQAGEGTNGTAGNPGAGGSPGGEGGAGLGGGIYSTGDLVLANSRVLRNTAVGGAGGRGGAGQ